MDHAYDSWGAVTFWLFIAAAAVAGHWERARRNTEKHETLRRMIEKTGTVDEAKLKELFNSRSSDWAGGAPGDAYRALRIVGVIIMGAAAGVVVLFFGLGHGDVIPRTASAIGMSVAGGAAMLGLGVFFSSHFAQQPSDKGSGTTIK